MNCPVLTRHDGAVACRQKWRPFFPWTFLGSILWIGFFSFLMNWWAATIGHIAGIRDSVSTTATRSGLTGHALMD